ncbi:MAG: EamA-like transporter family protein [Coprobacillus sp.]|nr:EamA-like transporter family protein [Coprobacillus sp.]
MSKEKLKDILFLQFSVLLYSLTGVFSKMSGNNLREYGLLSWNFIFTIFLLGLGLMIYAIVWQQILKRYDLSVAYANKGLNLFWTVLWSFIIFKEGCSLLQIVGICIISFGIYIINKEKY